MQGCSFKMVRQELPECTQRQSCSQDEGGERGGEQEDRKQRRVVMLEKFIPVLPCVCCKVVKLQLFVL